MGYRLIQSSTFTVGYVSHCRCCSKNASVVRLLVDQPRVMTYEVMIHDL